jgi:hypothetical protein
MRLSEIFGAMRGGFVGRRRRDLQSEVVRLRAENRALMNSILGIAGVPPVTVGAADGAGDGGVLGADMVAAASAAGTKREASARKKDVAPMRRRSWHQVNRMLEIDAARVKAAGDEI